MKKGLICLSSGTTPQYRLDILRVMALPEGAEIQFRYDGDLIDAASRLHFGRDQKHDTPALLAHLDLTVPVTTAGPRPIHPCRHAKLIASEELGQFYILRFRLGAFCQCSDLDGFRKHLATKGPQAKDGKLEGHWVFEDEFTKACTTSNEMGVWQASMKDLGKTADYDKESFFFRVIGLYRRGSDHAVKPADGEYKLKSNTEYEWRVFHFHPESDAHQTSSVSTLIQVNSMSDDIVPVTSPELAIDSSYDLKSFHFRTKAVTATDYTSFTIKFQDVVPTGSVGAVHPELFLPLKVVPSWWRAILSVLGLTVLLFLQQYISATAKGGIPHHTSYALLGLAFLTALVAVYALKKPL
ncbi:DUF5336 domain-containing protein [Edaphobacter flagellatus]|uniref:DUF5336 domain-containing protein n=1 Tax=Edaphobacter flagellatus TaxID=1933044 RepID=UPI0021B35683|nr:DUF5336 domain-containing protein [Edaphobacter flagellatus]